MISLKTTDRKPAIFTNTSAINRKKRKLSLKNAQNAELNPQAMAASEYHKSYLVTKKP